jgi:UDP-N-acetylglucosamine acyltransferase
MDIHQFAVVHPDAKIGENVKIGPFVTIDANVEIGDGTIIDSGAVVRSGARVGKNCHIHSNAVVGDIPQDLKFQGEDTVAIIGDNTVIREFVTIHRGTASRGKTVVGDNCLIMAYCHVAHDCIVGNHVIMSNAAQIAGEVEVADWAIIGGGALVHQFTRIGCHVMIQGGALVNKDIPPYCMVARYPIAYEGVNKVGLHRRGYSSEQIDAIADVYRTIYDSGLNVTQSLEEASKLPSSAERDVIIDFVRGSKRGIVRKPL